MDRLMGKRRISKENTDVRAYVVDGKTILSEVTNGLNINYYWQPTFGQDDETNVAN